MIQGTETKTIEEDCPIINKKIEYEMASCWIKTTLNDFFYDYFWLSLSYFIYFLLIYFWYRIYNFYNYKLKSFKKK